MPVTKQSISLRPDAYEQLMPRVDAARGNLSGAVSESLLRWFECLRRARASLRSQFTGPELAFLADILNGTLMQSYSIPLLWAEAEDALADGYAEKWGIDGPALTAKLRGLSYAESAALVDAVERWWSADDPRPEFAAILN